MFYVANSTDENVSTWSRLIGTRNWNKSTETKFKKLKSASIPSFSAKSVPQVKKKPKQKAKKISMLAYSAEHQSTRRRADINFIFSRFPDCS